MHNDPTFHDSQYSDPTEYHQSEELIPVAYHNPYETLNPYNGRVPTPPPPPKKWNIGHGIVSVSLLCVVIVLGGVIWIGQRQSSQITTVTTSVVKSAPTPAPTMSAPTPPPVAHPASSSANDIYNDFSRNGLSGVNVRSDNNWSCCTYIPEGGALAWMDSISGYTLDIAKFKNTDEANVDARELDSQNFASTVMHTCLLSYDNIVPGSVLSRYVQLMQIYCK